MFGIGAGKIEIRIPKIAYVVGEAIEGDLILSMNSPQKARGVFLRLYAEQKYREYTHGSGSHHSHGHWETTSRRVHEFVLQFDGEREYPKTSQPLVYPFRIYVPQQAHILRQNASGGFTGGAGPVGYPEWFLEAYLDLPLAFDVQTRVQLSI